MDPNRSKVKLFSSSYWLISPVLGLMGFHREVPVSAQLRTFLRMCALGPTWHPERRCDLKHPTVQELSSFFIFLSPASSARVEPFARDECRSFEFDSAQAALLVEMMRSPLWRVCFISEAGRRAKFCFDFWGQKENAWGPQLVSFCFITFYHCSIIFHQFSFYHY